MTTKIFLVYGSKGSYSSYCEWDLKCFRSKTEAENFRDAAERYLLDNGLFTREEVETKWGRRIEWKRTEDFEWECWKDNWQKLLKENPFDNGGDFDEGYGFDGYHIRELELEEDGLWTR